MRAGQGRRPAKRENFVGDAQTLLNLSRAIHYDQDRPVDWKANMCKRLEEIARELLVAPMVGSKRA